jgi:hypothetical protein
VEYFIGLDLGQSQDYTALSILEKVQQNDEAVYHLRRLERIRGEPYPAIISKVLDIMRSKALQGNAILVIDSVGCGLPVVDEFRKAGLKPIAIFIHGGENVTYEGDNYRVPKRDLVAVVKILLQNNRLIGSTNLKLGPVLQNELLNFTYKLNPLTAHDSYGCWREGIHDDLVLSVALAAWYGEKHVTPTTLTFSTKPMCVPAHVYGSYSY